MNICTDIGKEWPDEYVAWFVKCAIEGFARGCLPMARVWRLPPLYQSGIRFQPEPNHGTGSEEFALPALTFERKWGDCDDLVIYRLWELWCAGEPATCAVIFIDNQEHVRVRRGPQHRPRGHTNICQCEGCIEDPAVICGARAA